MTSVRRFELEAGAISNLELVERKLEDPPPGWVQVRVKCIGVNFADNFACLGLCM
jgi:NADPH:quinone reductase-like Zn-dependent oxidoreductase